MNVWQVPTIIHISPGLALKNGRLKLNNNHYNPFKVSGWFILELYTFLEHSVCKAVLSKGWLHLTGRIVTGDVCGQNYKISAMLPIFH